MLTALVGKRYMSKSYFNKTTVPGDDGCLIKYPPNCKTHYCAGCLTITHRKYCPSASVTPQQLAGVLGLARKAGSPGYGLAGAPARRHRAR